MANKDNNPLSGPQSQAQTASPEPDFKKKNAPENSDEPQFFDTTIAKLVERKNEETGETEWVEVLSDNLFPGEKLKRDDDAEKLAEKEKKAREDRAKEDDKGSK